MKALPNTSLTKPAPERAGRPKKLLDHRKLDGIVEVLPKSPVEVLETLLIFDARSLDKDTQQELIRILPQLIHIRRAWKAHFLEHGCLLCQSGHKPDPTRKIAVNLRRSGMSWKDIFKALTTGKELTANDRKLIQLSVQGVLRRRRRGTHPKVLKPKDSGWYGSGGFCNSCQGIVFMRMRNRFRKAMNGRDLSKELATLKDALCLRYNAAQRLFNGEA